MTAILKDGRLYLHECDFTISGGGEEDSTGYGQERRRKEKRNE